ncbi:lipase-like [Panicum miliaceum]|uniref:Lipase-like n=1 Tax=Panicum miliaceum TaxID=4540 RepID=A0A3L6TM49_PANMI|nr:lipase-like [Panicum miliaceum]
MDRPRRAVESAAPAAVLVLLLLSIAPPGGARRDWGFRSPSSSAGFTEPNTKSDVKNNGQTFVLNYTLAKAIVQYASAFKHNKYALFTDFIVGPFLQNRALSLQNWIKDMIWKQVNLNYPNVPNAKVHTGFYSSYNNTLLRPAITNAVRKARKLHRASDIIVTGHSMGGAIASFCALDLAIRFGSNNVHLMTFGQPRVGNAAFASYFAKYVPNTIRMTHERDIVPHLPPYFFFLPQLTYRHFPREVWEHEVDGNTTFQVCDGSGEDPNCCRSIFVLFWSASDHLTYMGVKIEADDWSTCRIVLGRSAEQLQMNLASNIVTSGRSVDVVIADDSTQVD